MAISSSGDDPPHPGASHHSPPGVAGLSSAVQPFTHTGQYFAQSWREYLDQKPDELPIARPTLALAAQAFRDEVVLMGLKARRPVSRPDVFERITREVVAGLEFYGDRGWLDNPKRFFGAPPPLSDVTVRKVKGSRRSLDRMFFDSGYLPRPGEPGAERWMGYTANNREYALLLRHPQPRPWLVCVHGTEMGRAAVDLAVFRAWSLHDDLGLNVVMPVLPMHGPRARGPAEGRGVSGRGHPRRRACDGSGGVGHPAAVVLDSSRRAGVADRVERPVAGRLHRGVGRQPRELA